uniref:Formate dehydrogenase accessory sulfurtransferase FdhD n=1 Tax=Ignisphaera aggregans TaxID=334771 RepID=A0A7C2ZCF2_9CREN
MAQSVCRVRISRLSASGGFSEVDDEVAREVDVELHIGSVDRVYLGTSPHRLLELALGYALTHKIGVDEQGISISGERIFMYSARKVEGTCRFPGKDVGLAADLLFKIFDDVMRRAELFRRTGCFHVAAIATLDGEIVELVEDVSRHCALYKAIGGAYRKGIDFGRSIAVLSSRASRSIVECIANVCIPIAIFRGAPTLEAVEVARKRDLTLIAHVRGSRANVYSGIERIRLCEAP